MKTSAISSRYLARGSFDGSLNLTRFPESTNRPAPGETKDSRRSRRVAALKSHIAAEMARAHAILHRFSYLSGQLSPLSSDSSPHISPLPARRDLSLFYSPYPAAQSELRLSAL